MNHVPYSCYLRRFGAIVGEIQSSKFHQSIRMTSPEWSTIQSQFYRSMFGENIRFSLFTNCKMAVKCVWRHLWDWHFLTGLLEFLLPWWQITFHGTKLSDGDNQSRNDIVERVHMWWVPNPDLWNSQQPALKRFHTSHVAKSDAKCWLQRWSIRSECLSADSTTSAEITRFPETSDCRSARFGHLHFKLMIIILNGSHWVLQVNFSFRITEFRDSFSRVLCRPRISRSSCNRHRVFASREMFLFVASVFRVCYFQLVSFFLLHLARL